MLLSSLLYPGETTETITARVTAFAKTDYDTEVYIADIESMLLTVLPPGGLCISDSSLRERLGCLAFQTLGPNTEVLVETGKDSSEAVLIWATCLCHCLDSEDAGMNVAFEQIAGYALRSAQKAALRAIWAMTGDCILAYGWKDLLHALFAHAAASVMGGLPSLAAGTIKTKLAFGCPVSRFYSDPDWWWMTWARKREWFRETTSRWKPTEWRQKEYEQIEGEIEHALTELASGLESANS